MLLLCQHIEEKVWERRYMALWEPRVRHSCLHAIACWVFGLRVGSSGAWKGAFILAEGQHFLYEFLGKEQPGWYVFHNKGNLIYPRQVGFLTYYVYFYQTQSP